MPIQSNQGENLNWRPRSIGEGQNVLPERNAVKKTIYITDVDHQVKAGNIIHMKNIKLLSLCALQRNKSKKLFLCTTP